MKKTEKITYIVVTAVTLVLVGVLVFSVVKSKGNTTDPEITKPTVTDQSNDENTDIKPITPNRPGTSTDTTKPDLDVSEMTRTEDPGLVGSDVQYGTKEESEYAQ